MFYRFEAQLEFVPIGVVPEGLRMANSYEGRVTEGEFLGARVWGIDHLLVRNDGVGIIDSQKTISHDTFHVYECVSGYCLPPADLQVPPLEQMMHPDFRWPDADFAVVAFSTFRVGVADLAYLNRAMARIDGWANLSSGALVVETRLVAHDAQVTPVRRDMEAPVAVV